MDRSSGRLSLKERILHLPNLLSPEPSLSGLSEIQGEDKSSTNTYRRWHISTHRWRSAQH